MLALPHQLSEALRLSPVQFAELCAANPDAVLELTADGQLIEMTPAGGETGLCNNRLGFQLERWARSQGGWCVFDSSTGFLLPDGSVRSPDASVVRLERWQGLTSAQREGFPPLCPDLVVELASSSDALPVLRRKMATYIENGAQLGWLLLPRERSVEVWSPTREGQVLQKASVVDGAPLLPGLQLDLEEIWAA
jgi:Uma2 family endonuclease